MQAPARHFQDGQVLKRYLLYFMLLIIACRLVKERAAFAEANAISAVRICFDR
jgi:hypothetical protein